ncbi:MAG TPA: hypothetical protein VII42_00590 [Caulobacteraceae bacterium]
MRVPILSVCCAALSLAALPAAAHGWSSSEAAEHNCPIVQPSHPTGAHHAAHPGAYHHAHVTAGCPVARPAPVHYEYQRVHTPNGQVAVQSTDDRWRQDRRAWVDNNWSGRGGPGCHDANGPGAYRDGDGHRAAPDRGMRCHDDGMRRERAYAQSSGQFDYTREVDSGWSSSERSVRIVRNDGWGGNGRRPSMTDRYGFLTWPGKTHFLHGQPVGPMGDAPDIGPQAPPEESWQVHP